MGSYRHSIRYINWKEEAQRIVLSNEDFAKEFAIIEKNGNRVCGTKTIRSAYEIGDYRVEKQGIYKTIYVMKGNGDYRIYTTNTADNNKNNLDRLTGPKAIAELIKKFAEINGLNQKGFSKAFGTVGEAFKACVPKQLYYLPVDKMHRKIKNVSAIDICSHYPNSMSGPLPDAGTAIEFNYFVPPSEEYPFAFYLDSGNCAEYEVFDTNTWIFSPLAESLFDDPDKHVYETRTILMKKSKYTLDKCWEFFYNRRKQDPVAKLVMNASIGMMHTKKYNSYHYAHLVAIALGRANERLRRLAEDIGFRDILHICVDGIIYYGKYEYGCKQKELGAIYQEFTDCTIKIRGTNCYIVKDSSDKVICAKHGAYNFNKDGTPIDISTVMDFDEQYNWIKIDPTEDIE
jgi:hypothetical protein